MKRLSDQHSATFLSDKVFLISSVNFSILSLKNQICFSTTTAGCRRFSALNLTFSPSFRADCNKLLAVGIWLSISCAGDNFTPPSGAFLSSRRAIFRKFREVVHTCLVEVKEVNFYLCPRSVCNVKKSSTFYLA